MRRERHTESTFNTAHCVSIFAQAKSAVAMAGSRHVGKLKVKLHRAKQLPDKDLAGKNDVYAELRFGTQEPKRTLTYPDAGDSCDFDKEPHPHFEFDVFEDTPGLSQARPFAAQPFATLNATGQSRVTLSPR